ncbi:MAG: hypothetical protein COC05_01725 [Gammaproteobacteria bacterium]|nr:MAG: hypothetical protein COC05_01725 [Gammaproteobacteria bacterium]
MNEIKKTTYKDATAFTIKDGSTIRELMHPQHHAAQNQSLAEAIVPAGTTTLLHKHHQTEEFYHILEGEGEMVLGDERFNVTIGDTVCIKPNTAHQITALGDKELRFICSCSPAYSHDDTELL